ncbi:MAG TPA: AgmX/PglI C-terminal domain-containing protein, partial [Myxococcales bacterium]|nr:AgmX/PglI C-terminal domain-containing protein [Myxococcales bacterium]
RLQLITGEADQDLMEPSRHSPALSVVREPVDEVLSLADQGANEEFEVPMTPPTGSAAVQVAEEEQPAPAPAPQPQPRLPPGLQAAGGECVEVELFWRDTRISVWHLEPGQEFDAAAEASCAAMMNGIARGVVLRSDVNGWTVSAPRPLQLFLQEGDKIVGGPELLVRGRSQADAQGLVVPLPARAVAVLGNQNLSLRMRRVQAMDRVAGEQTDWKGVLIASVAAVLMMAGLKFWSAAVPPAQVGGEPVTIRPRPLVVRAAQPQKPNDLQPVKPQNEGRRDPGKAVARHQGLEGEAGSRTAPRRDARAERKSDDRALVAETGLLKALGGGKGKSDLFGVALEKGTVDAMGHLTGPRVADAHGDGGMGLKSLGGHGGGGDGSGLGLARIGTNGIGGGLANYGDGKGGLRGKEDGDIGLGPGKPEVQGSIDPELIRKVVHEHRAQIRTCYETQLNSRPSLAGKLVSAWTIDQSGGVTEAHTQESTLRDREVEACVAAKIKSWRFPIPKGGGEVFVTYPFIFTPGG